MVGMCGNGTVTQVVQVGPAYLLISGGLIALGMVQNDTVLYTRHQVWA